MFLRPYSRTTDSERIIMEENRFWNKDIWEKYQAGIASKEELEQLQAYLQQLHRPELDQLFAEEQPEQVPADTATRIRTVLEQAGRTGTPVIRAPHRLMQWIAAAAVFMAIAVGSYYWQQRGNAPQLSAVPVYDSIINISGAPRLIKLPDATQVWLNKKAKLYISKTYAAQRQVQLVGEAYFDVVRNAPNPLVVHTGAITTTVLGTTFNVDNSNNGVRISLVQGKVQVNKEGGATAPVLLAPGETAIASIQTDTIASNPTAIADVAGWMRGHLVFNQLPLSEALSKAGEYYGLDIQADPALLQGKKVTTIYYKHQHWQEVLQHLLFMYQLTYATQHNRIVITRQ